MDIVLVAYSLDKPKKRITEIWQSQQPATDFSGFENVSDFGRRLPLMRRPRRPSRPRLHRWDSAAWCSWRMWNSRCPGISTTSSRSASHFSVIKSIIVIYIYIRVTVWLSEIWLVKFQLHLDECCDFGSLFKTSQVVAEFFSFVFFVWPVGNLPCTPA